MMQRDIKMISQSNEIITCNIIDKSEQIAEIHGRSFLDRDIKKEKFDNCSGFVSHSLQSS